MYALIALYCVAMYSVGLPHVRCMFILIVLPCAVFVVAMYSAGLPPVHYTRVQCWIAWVSNLHLTIEDRRVLAGGKWLTANHISASSSLLKQSFPNQMGSVIKVILRRNSSSHLHLTNLFRSFMLVVVIGHAYQCCGNGSC